MDYKEIKATYGEGRYQVDISSVVTSEGVSVTVLGGEKPHVGGTALSIPRTSLAGHKVSCDTWVNPVPGHKDTGIAVRIAEMICVRTEMTTAVVAGIHINQASEAEITLLVDNATEAARLLVNQITDK